MVVLWVVVMAVGLIGMIVCSKKQKTNPAMQPVAILLFLVVLAGAVMLLKSMDVFGGGNASILESEMRFAESRGAKVAKLTAGLAGGLLTDIPEKIAFLAELPEFGTDLFFNKKSKCSPEVAKTVLETLIPEFAALEDFSPAAVGEVIASYAEKNAVKLGQPMWAVRIALSGLPVTPGGPGEIMDILGREESLRRLNCALAKL